MAANSSTKSKSAAKKATAKKTPAKKRTPAKRRASAKKQVVPVAVNQFNRRSGDDAIIGQWVDVVSGEHEGRRGAYVSDETHDPATGLPKTVVVRSRDAENELLVVNYGDIRPSDYTGGR